MKKGRSEAIKNLFHRKKSGGIRFVYLIGMRGFQKPKQDPELLSFIQNLLEENNLEESKEYIELKLLIKKNYEYIRF